MYGRPELEVGIEKVDVSGQGCALPELVILRRGQAYLGWTCAGKHFWGGRPWVGVFITRVGHPACRYSTVLTFGRGQTIIARIS